MRGSPPMPRETTFAEISEGARASFVEQVTEEDIRRFADLSGDHNPLHMDDGYATTTEFGGRIAHGMLLGALLSRLVGMHLPGKFALYLAQTLDFLQPVRAGDKLEVSGEVLSKQEATRTVVIRTEVRDASGSLVARGRATVRVLR